MEKISKQILIIIIIMKVLMNEIELSTIRIEKLTLVEME